ncbi:MAG: type 12 methyltransferase [Parcubacteria group bacterium Gr01-1014_106]|nr:MAG: type 12 methyltransferase [Parcubacteria group bacterium Gr01-1014_106]
MKSVEQSTRTQGTAVRVPPGGIGVATDPDVFACHLCGEGTYRVIFDARNTLDDASRLVTPSSYACTTRLTSAGLRVVECRTCGLRVLHPLPDAAAVEHAYENVEDPDYLALEQQRVVTFHRLLDRIAQDRRPPGTLLDVGCYTGLFPNMALANGWDAVGVEPSRWAVETAVARLPGRIVHADMRTAPFPDASFDVVTAWDVIEHVTDLRADLQALVRLLRPQGYLYLSTMKSDALIARLLGARWPWYIPMHRYYFTPRTIRGLLASAGLAVRAIEPYPHYTTLGYICTKLEEGFFGPVARIAGAAVRALGIADRTVRVNLGDVMLIVAQRVDDERSPSAGDAG